MLLLRAVLAFVACPGLVAFAVPALFVAAGPDTSRPHAAALLPFAAGTSLLLWCVRDFYVAGRGTLAPWDPPRRLVVIGPYRFSRNPMYVAVALVLLGWAAAFRSTALLAYAGLVIVAFQLRVVFGEEPRLARSFGDEWDEYRRGVPRWIV